VGSWQTSNSAFLSVVIAARNAQGSLPRYLSELSGRLSTSFPNHEIVVVDSGSDDGTSARVQQLLPEIPNIHLFRLSGSAPQRVVVTAGLDQCIGDIVVIADHLFDPPEIVEAAALRIAEGSDAVYGLDRTRRGRFHAPFRLLARIFTWYLRRSTATDLPVLETGVRALSRRALNPWLANEDRDRLIHVMPALSGYDYSVLEYDGYGPTGSSTWALGRWLRVGIETLMASTVAPLRLATVLAIGASLLSLLYSVYVVAISLIKGNVVEGWVSLSLQSAGMFFLLSIVLAILSEYVFQITQRTHSRALYRVAEESSSPSFSLKERLNVTEDGAELAGDGGREFDAPRDLTSPPTT
jgi:glycosyltransferase involved in cell wall biosynthesis